MLDSCFCAAKFFIFGRKGSLFCCSHKKWRYWPNNVPGDSINRNFVNKEVEDVEILEAKMDDGNPFIYISLKIQIML